MTPQDRAALWERLNAAGLVSGELPVADAQRTPWYVRVMLGIAGWIGALFLFGFVGVGFALVMKSSAAALVVGAAVCGGAAVLLRAGPANDFLSQLGLAVSLAGQTLMAYGLGDLFGFSRVTLPLVLAVQQAVLFWLVPNFIHRVWAAWTGAFAITYAMATLGFPALAPAVVSAAFVVVWLREFDLDRRGALLRAGGYGLALATLQTCIMFGPLWVLWADGANAANSVGAGVRGWIGALAAGAVLVAAALMLLWREGLALSSPQGRVALVGAVMLALVSLKAAALGPAVAVLVVGYANGNRVLAGLGLLSLIGYLSHYYYAMQVTLLEKSVLLAAAGVALLVLRFALRQWWPARREEHA